MIIDTKERYFTETSEPPSFDWVGAPEGGGNGPVDTEFKLHRGDIEVIGGVSDDTLSYEYDEFALIRYKGKLYLLQTSGCSCPSPSETWGTVHGPITKANLKKEINAGNYQGFTLPDHLKEELLAVIEAA